METEKIRLTCNLHLKINFQTLDPEWLPVITQTIYWLNDGILSHIENRNIFINKNKSVDWRVSQGLLGRCAIFVALESRTEESMSIKLRNIEKVSNLEI